MTNQEPIHSGAIAALERIHILSSGSYNAAVDLRNSVIIVGSKWDIDKHEFEALKARADELVAHTREAVETGQRLGVSVIQGLGQLVEENRENNRTTRIELGVAIVFGFLSLVMSVLSLWLR
jgi:hypothetical protein